VVGAQEEPPGTTSLITCSRSAKVGFLRAMSLVSTWSRWFERGSTWSLKPIMRSVSAKPPQSTGRSSVAIPTPLALNAVISFSAARRLKA
jgi:hypothetical protein